MEFNSNLSMTGQASIELDYQRLNETAISTWQLREQELEERRNAYINVEIWLQSVHSSRPSPDTILNSLPQYMRQRVANEVVGRVDDVFSRSSRAATRGRPSSVQTTGASAVTVTSKRSAAASIIVPSFEERGQTQAAKETQDGAQGLLAQPNTKSLSVFSQPASFDNKTFPQQSPL
ncbi:hypothetical protein ACJ41O_008633 [Fusarium nematophilum]